MGKIHLIIGSQNNESCCDNDADSYLLCGTYADYPNTTRNKEYVDCKRCLRILENETRHD